MAWHHIIAVDIMAWHHIAADIMAIYPISSRRWGIKWHRCSFRIALVNLRGIFWFKTIIAWWGDMPTWHPIMPITWAWHHHIPDIMMDMTSSHTRYHGMTSHTRYHGMTSHTRYHDMTSHTRYHGMTSHTISWYHNTGDVCRHIQISLPHRPRHKKRYRIPCTKNIDR